MEGMKGGGGRIGVCDNEIVDGMQCIDHPNRNNPGGICAFCLQEKLGKLLSSSLPLPLPNPPPSSSSLSLSPSFAAPPQPPPSSIPLTTHTHHHHYIRSRLPFLLAKKKKNNTNSSSAPQTNIIFKRSKSTATPRRNQNHDHDEYFSPRKRNGFWSFLYLSSSKTSKLEAKSFSPREKCLGSSSVGIKKSDMVNVEEGNSPNSHASAKVSRSRSVGCGSRSFSGDLFERISSGLGDCTLRRVESHREGKPKVAVSGCMKERVRCGGIFGGFMLMNSSSSSSADDVALSHATRGAGSSSSSRSWGWAFPSPIRAFTAKTSSKDSKRDDASDKNATPNLSAIPSLLTVRG